MPNNLPRRPVRFVEQNDELLKAQEGIAGQSKTATDFSENVPHGTISRPTATYRTPADRVSGNEFFRRYLNGMLDIPYAVSKVLDAVHRAKDSGGIDQLNGEEKTVLGVIFPVPFGLADAVAGSMAAVQQRLSLIEVEQIRQAVAAHLQEELNYNAGRGGGSVPGRHQTKA
jgi:hypothetical protein